MSIADKSIVQEIRTRVADVVVGQDVVVERILIALLTGGHLLLEGVPGLAKTLLVNTVAKTIGMGFGRVQFTIDMLPSDVIGSEILDQATQQFRIHKGPVFTNLLLADEINRAAPKVQGCLLEAMQERKVTLGNKTFTLPAPFLVIATQNPIEQAGTYQLPEAQLDRFLMRTSVGHPDAASTEALLAESRVRDRAADLVAVVTAHDIQQMSQLADMVHVDPAVISYVRRLAEASREVPDVRIGLSTRGCLAWVRAAKAWALAEGRGHVVPEDVATLALPVLGHRIIMASGAAFGGTTSGEVVEALLAQVPVPRDRA